MKYLLLFFSILSLECFAQEKKLVEKLKNFIQRNDEPSLIQGTNPRISENCLSFQVGSEIRQIKNNDTLVINRTLFRKESLAGISGDSLFIAIPASLSRNNIFLYLDKSQDSINYEKTKAMPFGSEYSELGYNAGFFCSNRPGGIGEYDLYYFDGKRSKNLEPLNTIDNEVDPWIYKNLIFFTRNNSEGSKIFYSKMSTDEFSEPTELRLAINDNISDFSFAIDSIGNIESVVFQKDSYIVYYHKSFNLSDDGVVFVEVPKDEIDSIPDQTFRAIFFKTTENDSLDVISQKDAEEIGLIVDPKTLVLRNPEVFKKFKEGDKYKDVVENIEKKNREISPNDSFGSVKNQTICVQIGYYQNNKKFHKVLERYLHEYSVWIRKDSYGINRYYIIVADEVSGLALKDKIQNIFIQTGIFDKPFLTTFEEIVEKEKNKKT